MKAMAAGTHTPAATVNAGYADTKARLTSTDALASLLPAPTRLPFLAQSSLGQRAYLRPIHTPGPVYFTPTHHLNNSNINVNINIINNMEGLMSVQVLESIRFQ